MTKTNETMRTNETMGNNKIMQSVNFMLSMPVDLREQIKVAAVHDGLTMNNFILLAVQEKLNKINEEK